MTLQMWATLAILVMAVVLFITEWLRVDMVALSVVILLMLTRVLTVEEVLAGFSDPAVLTIASLFMVGGAVFQTGLAGMIATRILKIAGQNEVRLTAAIMIAVAGLDVVLTGCLTMDEAYEAIDWKSLVLIAGMLPMSTALVKVGLVSAVATGFVDTLGNFGPLAVMAGLFLLTSFFTQVLSNTATAVLVAPIALATAGRLGVQPYAFLMAVAVAASMAFASPVGSPVNTLVIGAGSYRFRDYIKVGFPMIAVSMVVVLIALPILWPF